jgi:signal transduction histidine kinase
VTLGREERHIERTLTPVRDLEEQIVGWLFIFRDISEEIELARLKDEMTHMLVHDLRSPLALLKGSLGLIETSFADRNEEEFGQLLGMAQRNSERMLDMVNELLEISKLESGELKLHPEAVEVRSLLEDTAARHAVVAAHCKIALEIAVDPDLPAVYVDLSLITRVLNNLLDNAIKFTPDGGHIRLWSTPDPAPSTDHILIGVTDTGPGIPQEAHSQVFEKFQQIESVRGRRAGTGLGLSFCKLVVEAHAGRIWVESEPTQGSTFLMTLPLSPKHTIR